MTSEQRYYLTQNIRNPKVALNHIAERLNVERDVIDIYLTKNYCTFAPYIRLRKENP